VDESVVESGQKMDDSEVVDFGGSSGGWWSEVGNLFFFQSDLLLWWLYREARLVNECVYLPF